MLAGCSLAVAQVSLDSNTGAYAFDDPVHHWHFAGNVPTPVTSETRSTGRDRIGNYNELSFLWNEGGSVTGTIRWYANSPVVWFRAHYNDAQQGKGVVFPNFTTFPTELRSVSFEDTAFAHPTSDLKQTSTPWLFLNEKAQTMLFSPASEFMVAKMTGDEKSAIGEGLNLRMTQVPKGLDQDSILAFGDGVGTTWDAWGSAMRKLYQRKDVNYEADVLLRSFGYWTDNGADYYYNYDQAQGYANTLLAVKKQYDQEQIPLSYLQLDSWWYSKTLNDPAGRPGKAKNAKLPEGAWNRYGGLLEYKAHPALFPNGLDGFEKDLGLPMAVHNRWVDHDSPYHQSYKISGVGAVDPKWWADIASYLKSGGVTTYEQDWLSAIYASSPEMATTVGPGDAFADGMANATNHAGLTMQYCMATPRFFLQGVKYPNLTTIRTSGDRFEPRKWTDFLLVSQLAVEMGIAPWCDVFKSSEGGNLILSVLSCGPVGTGDALGKENVANIHRAVRADGIIVKPDRSLLPNDKTWLELANGDSPRDAGVTASTFTQHAAAKTIYLFKFSKESAGAYTNEEMAEEARHAGNTGLIYILDLKTGHGAFGNTVGQGTPYQDFAYVMVAPLTKCGIAFLGDLSKIVPTGKQRIAEIKDDQGGLLITVHFAKGEDKVTLSGACIANVSARAISGSVAKVQYDPTLRRFTVEVSPPSPGADETIWIGPNRV